MIATRITRNTTPPTVDPIMIALRFERTNEDDSSAFSLEDPPTLLLVFPSLTKIFFPLIFVIDTSEFPVSGVKNLGIFNQTNLFREDFAMLRNLRNILDNLSRDL